MANRKTMTGFTQSIIMAGMIAVMLGVKSVSLVEAQSALLGPGAAFMGGGISGIGTGELDDRLAERGYPTFGGTAAAVSGGGYRILSNGVMLGAEEQRRRWVIKSLLRSEGLSLAAYSARFGTNVFEDLPELKDLESRQLARTLEGQFVLTPQGLELSDAIGVWLYSVPIVERMETCELR